MSKRNTETVNLILPVGTQVVLRAGAVPDELQGAVAEVTASPETSQSPYVLQTADGKQLAVLRDSFSILKQVTLGPLHAPEHDGFSDLERFVIYRCVVGSRAYGLSNDGSDVDRRGIYLPPANLEWSLYGIPEQIERRESDECYWELKKFLTLALKSNPNILECLFTPMLEYSDRVGNALREQRHIFLSKLAYQTYNGYVMSQFKKLEQDIRTRGEIKWKHAMHLIRLLLQGIDIMEQGTLTVRVEQHREDLLAIREGALPWKEVNTLRLDLHRRFEQAFQKTALPDAPDYDEADKLLKWARRSMVND